MASLNWAQLSPPPSLSPIPLPHEKFLLSLPSIDLHLAPSPPGAPINPTGPTPPPASIYSAKGGAVHLSNKRLVFVAGDAHSPAPAQEGHKPRRLDTFSVPYSHFLDGRFVQPWFGANYYEALCLPSEGGGLSTPHLLKLTFKEAGGGQFYQVVEEMKNRLGVAGSGRGTPMEALPLYTPAPSSSSTTQPAQTPAPTQPQPEDLLAASIARSAEEAEEAVLAGAGNVLPPPPPTMGEGEGEGGGERREGPPGYEP